MLYVEGSSFVGSKEKKANSWEVGISFCSYTEKLIFTCLGSLVNQTKSQNDAKHVCGLVIRLWLRKNEYPHFKRKKPFTRQTNH